MPPTPVPAGMGNDEAGRDGQRLATRPKIEKIGAEDLPAPTRYLMAAGAHPLGLEPAR